ncbi:MAG: class I tRNA ligase family protein, partial [Candidatus Omnitrophota bacterium]
AVGYDVDRDKFNQWWPPDIQLIGKDILRHHAIFWPIMLKALGVSLPKVIFAHGWWKVDEEKMSKSKGNIVNPYTLIEDVGVDALRYFLLREIAPGADGNFSHQAVINRLNSDLANDLGNLVYRTLNMAEKYFEGKVSSKDGVIPFEFKNAFDVLGKGYAGCMEKLDFGGALDFVFDCIKVMNKYIEDTKPWGLWKEKKIDELGEFLYALLEGIRIVAGYLYSFMPQTCHSVFRQLGVDKEVVNFSEWKWSRKKVYSVKKEKPLFPRIEIE